jgi:hypothetical protein
MRNADGSALEDRRQPSDRTRHIMFRSRPGPGVAHTAGCGAIFCDPSGPPVVIQKGEPIAESVSLTRTRWRQGRAQD